ncbi:MFS transporter [Lapidilactobacillus wuchangensis]|uniref:MFS transporter n=1 Tax=Lapidilactobacillus wuchangensis TaxID=2486001 RepID=UPI000F7B6D6B|nr:MFS transporter [Lapidilactobacillus wuchangensis]
MFSLLLGIIYVAFISLGLPDSLIGAGWPVMHTQLNVPVSYAGMVTMIIAGDTIISSLFSDRMTRKLGAGMVTALSVLTTAVALFGFSISTEFWQLCLWAIPYGLGAGAVDAALNNFVALHFNSRQMNWLHCFWGVGAAISPYIMSYALTHELGWHAGYWIVGILQVILTAVLFISLPLWKISTGSQAEASATRKKAMRLPEILRIPGLKIALLTFISYCSLEAIAGLWASSFLVQARQVLPATAAKFASLFYIGITIGRFLSGLVADKLGDRKLIVLGSLGVLVGVIAIVLPLTTDYFALFGLVIVGLGCAPIYPSIIHATPFNFGAETSQAVIGVQMASAYIGSTFAPPLFGLVANWVGLSIYPWALLLFVILLLGANFKLNQTIDQQHALNDAVD